MTFVHLISDLHLEFNNPLPEIPTNVDILLLAGDIGFPHLSQYRDLLITCSEKVKHLVLITGNHEYYHSKGFEIIDQRIIELIENLKKNQQITNIHFLQRSFIDIDGYRILGCTLWSKIPSEYSTKIELAMNDYRMIRKKVPVRGSYRRVKITSNDVNKWHQLDFDWLKEEIELSPLPVVVITHHAPTLEEIDCSIDHAYFSQIDDINLDKVVLWVYGHTHRAKKYQHKVTTFWCNPVGYPGEETNYSKSLLIEL